MDSNKDLLKVYAYAEAIFTSFKQPTEKFKAEATALIWLKFLKPYSLDVIYSAIDQHAKNSDFMNIVKVAELCQEAENIKAGTHKTAEDYYREIEKAIYGATNGITAREEFDKLSDVSKAIVGAPYILGSIKNDGISFHATRLREQIADKLRSESMQKSVVSNARLLQVQYANNKLLEQADE